jgi:hypothetical protein
MNLFQNTVSCFKDSKLSTSHVKTYVQVRSVKAVPFDFVCCKLSLHLANFLALALQRLCL